MRDSAKWRVVIGEMNTKWYDAQREAARQLEEAVRPWNPTNLALYWKNANEDNLMEHLIFCALTPQTKVETLERILEDQFVTRNAGFRGMSESQISEELKSGGVRFPRNKARQIRELTARKLSIHAFLDELGRWSNSDLEHERWVRLILIDVIRGGLGLKVASLFLKDVGFASHLAVLDSQNFRYAKKVGLIPDTTTNGILQYTEVYYKLEDWEHDLANRLGVATAAVDWPIMAASQ